MITIENNTNTPITFNVTSSLSSASPKAGTVLVNNDVHVGINSSDSSITVVFSNDGSSSGLKFGAKPNTEFIFTQRDE